jgi:hypothetical protein
MGADVVQESEGSRAALLFGSIRVQEGSHRLGHPEEGKRPRVGRCWAAKGQVGRSALVG